MRTERGARALVSWCLAVTLLLLVGAPLFPLPKAEPIVLRKKKAKTRPSPGSTPASAKTTRTTAVKALEPELRDREEASFSMSLPRGWGATTMPGAAAAFVDRKQPGVGMAIYLHSEPKMVAVTEALVSFFKQRKGLPGTTVRWRECRPIAGRPALVCEFQREGKAERHLLVPRETGRRGRYYFRMQASLAAGTTATSVTEVDKMFASFKLVEESKPTRKPATSVAPARPTTPEEDDEDDESEEESPKSTAPTRSTSSVARTTASTIPERPIVYATDAIPPTTEEAQFASLLVTATADAGPGGLQRKVRNVLAFGNVERASLLCRVWPRASDVVVDSLDTEGPEARTMLKVRERELFEVGRRVVKEANKKFPAQVVGLEYVLHPNYPGFVEATVEGLHRYRATDPHVSAWMVERAREIERERVTPLAWKLTPHPVPGPEWEEARFVPRALICEVDPRTGALDARPKALGDVLARNRWPAPRASVRTALRDAAIAYRRCMAALRGASPVAGALGAARHVVAAVSAADAARLTTHTPEEIAALAFYGALVETPDLKRAVARVGPALTALGAAANETDGEAVAILAQPFAEKIVRGCLRQALAARLEEVERPRQTPDETAVMLLETAAARAGDAWDRQVARRLIGLQGDVADAARKRELLAHGVARVTEQMDVELVEDLAWIPAGVRDGLLAEVPYAGRAKELEPLVKLVAREDPALMSAARWLDRRVRLVAAGPAARIAAGRWGKHVPAVGVAFATLAVWGKAGVVASVITTAEPVLDPGTARELSRAFYQATGEARRATRWVEEAGGSVLGTVADERDSMFASLRPAQDLAMELEHRCGPTTQAVDLLAGPWLDEQDPKSVFQKLRWTPQTLAQDLGVLSVAATRVSTEAGHDPAVEDALEDYKELASVPEPARTALKDRLLGVLSPAVELSRGYLQKLDHAAGKDLKRRDRLVARELRSGNSGLATAISLFWSIASVNRALDQVDPRAPKVR